MNDKWEKYKASDNTAVDKWSKYRSSNFVEPERLAEPESNQGSLSDFLAKQFRESLKTGLGSALGHVTGKIVPNALGGERLGQAIGYGEVPALEQIPTGVKEGLQRAYAGITGGQFTPSQIPEEYGAGFGRGLGSLIGQQVASAPASIAGGLVGGPWGAIAGYGLGTAATTPGPLGERLKEGAIASAIPTAGRVVSGAAKGLINNINKYRVKPKAHALEEAESALAHHELGEQQLKNIAGHEFGQQNPERLLMSAEDKAKQLEAGLRTQRLYETPETQQMLVGQQTPKEAQAQMQRINENIRQVLNEGEAHGNRLSQHLVNDIEGIETTRPHPKTGLPQIVRVGGERERIGRKYDQLEENLPTVHIPQSVDTKAIEQELKQLISSKSNMTDAEKDNLKRILIESHPSSKGKMINGKEFFRAYRSLMRQEGKERSKAFSGLGPKEHDEWIARANNTKAIAEEMENIINQSFPKNTLRKLHEINHEYATQIAPLHENEIYQQMLKHGRYKGNLIEALSGTTKGNNILNRMITNNPEYTRLVLGKNFAKNPERLLEPNELVEPYLNAHPELQQLSQLQRVGQRNLEQAQFNEPLVEQIIQNNKLREEISRMNDVARELQNKMNQKDIAKATYNRLRKELEETYKKRAALKATSKTLINRGGWVGTAALGTYIGHKLANK